MRPLTLRFKAFASYRTETFLDFSRIGEENFFLIHGNTGAGKTSILDAIVYALYGGDGTMGGRSNLVMRNAEAAPEDLTEVDFHFALRDAHYRVHRTLTQKRKRDGSINPTPTHSAALYKCIGDEERLLDGRSATSVTQAVTSLIGLGATEFRQVVLLPQGAFREFLVAEPKTRRDLFSKIFQTQRFKKLAKKLEDKAKEGADAQAKQADLKAVYLKQAGFDTLDAFIAHIDELASEERAMQADITPRKEASEVARKAYEHGQDTARKIAQVETAKSHLQAALDARDSCAVQREQLIVAKRAAALEDTKSHLDETERKSADLQRDLIANDKALDALHAQRKDAQAALDAAAAKESQLEELRHTRRTLDEQQKHLDNYREKKTALDDKKKRAEKAKEAADRTAKAPPLLRTQMDALQRDWKAAMEIAATLDGLEHMLRDAERKETIAREGKTLKAEIDALKQHIETHQRDLAAATEKASKLAKSAEDLADARILGQAHELASRLKEGSPCPVCGATHHPAPQLAAMSIPTEEEVKSARNAAQTAETARQALSAALLSLQNEHDNKSARRDELVQAWNELPKIAQTKDELKRTIAEAKKAKATLSKYSAQQEDLRHAIAAAETEEKSAASAYRVRSDEVTAAQGALDEVQKMLPQGISPEEVDAKRNRIEQEIAAITAASARAKETWDRVQEEHVRAMATDASLKKQAKIVAADLARLQDIFQARLQEAGFHTIDAWKAALTGDYATEAGRVSIEARLQETDRACTAAEGAFKSAEAAASGLKMPNIASLQAAANTALDAWNLATKKHALKVRELQDKKELQSQIEKILAKEKALDEAYGILTHLAKVANGRVEGGQKKTRMDLETYVLRLLLGDVIEAANQRLIKMSQGQYLLDPPNTAEIDVHSGLDFTVFDENTGKSRDIASLSGGESFLVALSLSLGLSDTIVYYANSRPLDTLFIDEGFGTLSGEKLDTAIHTLLDLRDSGRLVGIISHVEELKNSIDIRLEVTKSVSTGSHAKFVVNV